jgi:tRNA nucleotidyltransferase (CCA-adding enzyme)
MIKKIIEPTEQESSQHHEIVKTILSKIKIPDAVAVLGGSGAKNTWLSGSTDIDIYVKFNYEKYKDSSDKLSNILERYLKKKFKITRLHGSRDYFQTKLKNYTIEVVPILNIKKSSEAKNITDVSQLHVNYVKKYPKLSNEIRLAKAFAKSQRVYGAESYIKGFSGYVLEILIIHYKSFKKLIKAASKWKSLTKIGKSSSIKNLNFSKRQSPLILIDPVQSDRNAAAALSDEKYNLFIGACKKYVKQPSESFFKHKELNIPKSSVVLNVTPKKGKQDVIGAKMLKLFDYIAMKIEENDFKIAKKDWSFEEGIFYYTLKSKKLPDSKIIQGPPLKLEEHAKKFKKKYKTFIKNKKLYAKIKRKYVGIDNLIKDILKEKHVKRLVSSVRI